MNALALLCVLAPQAVKPVDLAPLKPRLDAICKSFEGRMGYSLKLLGSPRRIAFRGDERFPTASTIKTAVMVEAVRQVEEGKLKWSDKRPMPDKNNRESSMWSFYFRDDVAPDLDGWVNLMIGVSDNTATMVLRDWLGFKNVNDRMESLGLQNTKFLSGSKPADGPIWRLRRMFGMGMTTPTEMNRLLEMIALDQAASPAACEKMIRILSRQYWDDVIGASVPPVYRVASKSGAISRSRSDTGIVYGPRPYVLTIYTDGQKDQRWAADNAGDLATQKLAREAWSFLGDGKPYRQPEGSDKFAPTGGGV